MTVAGTKQIVTLTEKNIVAVGAADGKLLWKLPFAPQYNTPVLKDGLLFGLSDRGNLFCINAQTGETAWTDTAQHGKGFAAIVSADDAILALPSTSELIVFKPDGKAYSEIAKYKVAETPTYAHPILSDNHIFVKDQESLAMYSVE